MDLAEMLINVGDRSNQPEFGMWWAIYGSLDWVPRSGKAQAVATKEVGGVVRGKEDRRVWGL
jgi:hypothetical protein